jgi:Dolichyl-phosphate-mannose-protein mannosyltransferase
LNLHLVNAAGSPGRAEIDSPPAARLAGLPIARLLMIFLGIGVGLRVVRYLLAFPLWGDEYQLAANFLNRNFAQLLLPLDHNQVAPVGFLWIELAAIWLFGFSELSLRLFPALCSIASVFLFRRVAGRLFSGMPLVLATAIFAVAYYPIRHGAEVKPYASDLCLALLLWSVVLDWHRAPRAAWRLWGLAVLAPCAMAVSFTAVIIAGGLSLGIAWSLWQQGRLRERAGPWLGGPWIGWLAFNLAVGIAFLGLMRLNVAAQYDTARDEMTRCWADGFPPWREPLALVAWLADVHTGEMFAYPAGAEHGGSSLTFFCFCLGMFAMARGQNQPAAVTILGWFALSMVAAILHRYPYGSHARLSQYLAPAICLAGASGAALVISSMRQASWRIGMLRAGLAGCGLIAAVSLGRDVFHPYKSTCDRDHREFARRFWNDSPEELTVCLQADLGLAPYAGSFETAYRCYQRIVAPAQPPEGRDIGRLLEAAEKPVRCIAYHSASARRNPGVLDHWMESMLERYDLTHVERQTVPLASTGDPLADYYLQCYDTYHFVPKSSSGRIPPVERVAGR